MTGSVGRGGRSALVDVLKGLACTVIVLHHLSAYGPPVEGSVLWDGIFVYGRFAVQVFLVLAGYMTAATLAPQGLARFENGWRCVVKRYLRLTLPYVLALGAAVAATAFTRQEGAARLGDVLIHVLMLQDLLGVDALSAGVWYLAIDLQLFALTVLILAATRWLGRKAAPNTAQYLSIGAVALLSGASLLGFNRHPTLDVTALYFYGSYGLGMLSYWALHVNHRPMRLALLATLMLLGTLACAVEFRARIALALCVVLTLLVGVRTAAVQRLVNAAFMAPLRYMGRISYSVFLMHYPVLLLIMTMVETWLRPSPWVSVFILCATFACAIAAAGPMHRYVENLPLSPKLPRRRLALRVAPL